MLGDAMVIHPLVEVSEFVRAEAARSRVAVVFDLDSTLFDVSPRTQFILRALGDEAAFASVHADVAQSLSTVEVLPSDYSVRTILRRTSPAAATDSTAVAEAVRAYWREHFFSSDHLHRDVLYPSADEYVRLLHGLGAEIFYLTGRGEARMRDGTVRALVQHGFPLAPGALLMKPSEVLSDEGFKADVLGRFTHNHVWLFENEPVIIAQVRRLVPRVRVVFVRSAHSGKAAEPTDVPAVPPDYRMGIPRK